MLEMAKESSFIMVSPTNNGQMDLKINFIRYYFSVLKILFNSIGLLFEWLNVVKPQLLAIPNIHVKYYPF